MTSGEGTSNHTLLSCLLHRQLSAPTLASLGAVLAGEKLCAELERGQVQPALGFMRWFRAKMKKVGKASEEFVAMGATCPLDALSSLGIIPARGPCYHLARNGAGPGHRTDSTKGGAHDVTRCQWELPAGSGARRGGLRRPAQGAQTCHPSARGNSLEDALCVLRRLRVSFETTFLCQVIGENEVTRRKDFGTGARSREAPCFELR
jgi:hypothetical protein